MKLAMAMMLGALTPVTLVAAAEVSPMVLFTAVSGKPTAADVKNLFDEARAAGFGQIMVYPRSGLEYEYMSEDWLRLVGDCLAEGRARGMKVWLYDEYNWPSGSCKGRVPSENPEWMYTEYAVWRKPEGGYRWEIKRNESFSMYDKYFDVNAYSAPAIRRFIELTHEVYEKRFGAYMKDGTIPGIFTDEPAHPSVMTWPEGGEPLVHFRWYAELEDQYRARTGRDFRRDVEAALDDPSKGEVWETYTALKGEQFRRAYFDQIRAWADRVGIRTCGHMISEGWPRHACNYNGLPLNTLRGLSLPGMDKISCAIGEWITYATAQYAIERNSTPGKDTLDCSGGIELFALGPCDLTVEQMAQRIWLAALYGMDTYYMSLYHTSARGFLEKGAYAMFVSPTQPYFRHLSGLHAEAREAAALSRKRFVRHVAVRYPQRALGRLEVSGADQFRDPSLNALVEALARNQVSFELVQDDEKSDLPFVFAFRGPQIIEEKSGRMFGYPESAVAFVHGQDASAWRVVDAAGNVVPDLLVRHYADGTGIVLNLTERPLLGLKLRKGAGGSEECVSLPACGLYRVKPSAVNWEPRPILSAVDGADWQVTFGSSNLARLWFTTEKTCVLNVRTEVRDVRFLVCDYPLGSVRITLDGRPLVAESATARAPYAYCELYRETAPQTLSAGRHVLKLEGRADDSIFLPVLWLSGDFRFTRPATLDAPDALQGLGNLTYAGYPDYVGEVVARATVEVPAEKNVRLAVDTAGLPARVRLGGVDLGERSLPPWEWEVPEALVGQKTELEVSFVTSVRPAFGDEKTAGVKLRQKNWGVSSLAGEWKGLRGAFWLKGAR